MRNTLRSVRALRPFSRGFANPLRSVLASFPTSDGRRIPPLLCPQSFLKTRVSSLETSQCIFLHRRVHNLIVVVLVRLFSQSLTRSQTLQFRCNFSPVMTARRYSDRKSRRRMDTTDLSYYHRQL